MAKLWKSNNKIVKITNENCSNKLFNCTRMFINGIEQFFTSKTFWLIFKRHKEHKKMYEKNWEAEWKILICQMATRRDGREKWKILTRVKIYGIVSISATSQQQIEEWFEALWTSDGRNHREKLRNWFSSIIKKLLGEGKKVLWGLFFVNL